MKKLVFAFILVISIRGFGQKVDHYITPAGDTIKIGDTVTIGPGTKPDGKYKYIDGFVTPGVEMTGQRAFVKKIIKRGNNKLGYRYFAILWPGAGIVNYEVHIEYALKSGEVELRNK